MNVDTTRTITPVAVQAYHVSGTFDAGSYRLVTGAAVDQKIYITGLQVITDTMPFRLEDSAGNVLYTVNGNSMGTSGGMSTGAGGTDIIAVFGSDSPTIIDMWLTAFIA